MKVKRKSTAQRILEAEVAIGNALSDTGIKAAVALFGYTEKKLKSGKALLDCLKELVLVQKNAFARQLAATAELYSKKEEAYAYYLQALQVARIVFNGNITAGKALGLRGKRGQALSAWLGKAEQFYINLAADETFMAGMALYGYGSGKIEEGLLLTEAVKEARNTREIEKGKARQAANERDAKLNELGRWISDFKRIAAVALAKNPQWLEKLGVVVK